MRFAIILIWCIVGLIMSDGIDAIAGKDGKFQNSFYYFVIKFISGPICWIITLMGFCARKGLEKTQKDKKD